MNVAMIRTEAPQGSRLVTADGRVLPLRGVDLRADALRAKRAFEEVELEGPIACASKLAHERCRQGSQALG